MGISVNWSDTYDIFAKIMWLWFHGMSVLFVGVTLYIFWATIKIWRE